MEYRKVNISIVDPFRTSFKLGLGLATGVMCGLVIFALVSFLFGMVGNYFMGPGPEMLYMFPDGGVMPPQ